MSVRKSNIYYNNTPLTVGPPFSGGFRCICSSTTPIAHLMRKDISASFGADIQDPQTASPGNDYKSGRPQSLDYDSSLLCTKKAWTAKVPTWCVEIGEGSFHRGTGKKVLRAAAETEHIAHTRVAGDWDPVFPGLDRSNIRQLVIEITPT